MKQSFSEGPDLAPGLAAALASLDLTVDAELLRYRRDRLMQETKALAPSPETTDVPLAIPASAPPSPEATDDAFSSPTPASPLVTADAAPEDAAPFEAPQASTNALQADPPPVELGEDAAAEQPTPLEPHSDLAIEGYLESSEALVKHLEATATAPAPAVKPLKSPTQPWRLIAILVSGLGVAVAVGFAGLDLNPWRSPQPSPTPTNITPPSVGPSSWERSPSSSEVSRSEANVSLAPAPLTSSSVFFAVTTNYTGETSLAEAQQVISDAYVIDTPQGKRIQLGAYDTQQTAEAFSQTLEQRGMAIQILAPQSLQE